MMTEQTLPAIGTKLPLLFNFRECLFGDGIVVEVTVKNGRALSIQEPDGYWMYGVNPGAMAATGETAEAAREAFRGMFSSILKEYAVEAPSLDAFQKMVGAFFTDTNTGYEREWRAAVDVVRRENINIEGLKKTSADSKAIITIAMKQLAQVQPADNEADLQLAQAA
jgi:hypothetical protein